MTTYQCCPSCVNGLVCEDPKPQTFAPSLAVSRSTIDVDYMLDPKRHPDDVAAQFEAELDAAEAIEAFFKKHMDRFIALVQIYPDDEAVYAFDRLRDDFWAQLPSRSVVKP